MRTSKKEKCAKHKLTKSYFCQNTDCNKALCPECVIEEHFSHQLTKLKELYEEKKQIVESAMELLKPRISEMQKKEKAVANQIEEVKKLESAQIVAIQSFGRNLSLAV